MSHPAPAAHSPTYERYAALPKAHLHVHLEAAMRSETMGEWCAEDGVEVPPLVEFPDFTRFLDAYGLLISLLRTPERVGRLLDEVVADAAAQGVVALEFASIPDKSAAFNTAEDALGFILPAAAAGSQQRNGQGGACRCP